MGARSRRHVCSLGFPMATPVCACQFAHDLIASRLQVQLSFTHWECRDFLNPGTPGRIPTRSASCGRCGQSVSSGYSFLAIAISSECCVSTSSTTTTSVPALCFPRILGTATEQGNTTLTANRALFNVNLGIEAVSGVTDGGGNSAKHNGNRAQCVNVSCSTTGEPK
jgi:hypothetical protein